MSAGLQLGLSELYDLDMKPLDLVAAMQLLFEGSETLGAEWLAGAPSFEAARGGDATRSESAQHLSGALPSFDRR